MPDSIGSPSKGKKYLEEVSDALVFFAWKKGAMQNEEQLLRCSKKGAVLLKSSATRKTKSLP